MGARKTSVSLEQEFWAALKAIAARDRVNLGELIGRIDRGRTQENLSSALRVFVLQSFRRPGTEAGSAAKRVVLVVDDDPLVLNLTATMLEELGCEVVAATNGPEALDKLRSDARISLMFTDIKMPGLTGHELAERAQRTRAGLPVILLSGEESDGRGLPLIRKPFLPSDLTRVMGSTTGPG